MMHHDSDLFYDTYNIINEHNQSQTHDLSLILNYFDMYFLSESKSKKSFYNFICLIINHGLYVIFSSLSIEQIKLFATVN